MSCWSSPRADPKKAVTTAEHKVWTFQMYNFQYQSALRELEIHAAWGSSPQASVVCHAVTAGRAERWREKHINMRTVLCHLEMQSEQKLGFGWVQLFVFQSMLFILCPPQISLFCATLGIRKLLQGWLACLCSAAPHPQFLKRDAAMGSSLLLLHTFFNICVPLQLQANVFQSTIKIPWTLVTLWLGKELVLGTATWTQCWWDVCKAPSEGSIPLHW